MTGDNGKQGRTVGGSHPRRRFLKRFGQGALAAGAALHTGRSVASPGKAQNADIDIWLPGRLGNPQQTLIGDQRLDPRIAKVMANMPAPGPNSGMPQISLTSSYEESLRWVSAMEGMLAAQDPAILASMPEFKDVVSRKETIQGVDANAVELYVDEPVDAKTPQGSKVKRPCVVHIHGGGMCFTTAAAASAVRWRKTLAQQGVMVVGVEFRNAGGILGNHPFPAGLNDCASAVQWVHAHRTELGISSLVLAGESGGGNLAVALGIKANLEGWIAAIDGVFAIAPMIFGYYGSVPPELVSWRENEGYQGTLAMTRAMARVYDPEDRHALNPLAWPYNATSEQLQGLPPHIITNYELDLIRDDGAIFARKLQAAGVAAFSRTITGAIHVVELAMPDLVPELLDETVASLVGFAGRLAD